MNTWMGQGRLGSDIELRQTAGGQTVARVLLAVDRFGKGGKKGTDWIRLVIWGRTAETCKRYVGKGSEVVVQGRLSSEFWERDTGDGKKSQLTTEVVVERIDFVGPPRQQPATAGSVDGARTRGKGA